MSNIRLATKSDIFLSYNILDACRKTLASRGILQWTEHYPTEQSIATDVHKSEGYVYEEEQTILGYMQVCDRQDLEYAKIPWKVVTDNVLTVHRLAIDPIAQGKGIAHKMMDFVEQLANQNNFDVIRLDAYSKNLIALNFYQNKGYYICGETYFPFREHSFYCFEKPL